MLKQGVKITCERLQDGQMMGEKDNNGYKYLGVLEEAKLCRANGICYK